MDRKSHTYFGVIISPIRRTIAGCTWEAYCAGSFLYADTLDGMKSLIRTALHKES